MTLPLDNPSLLRVELAWYRPRSNEDAPKASGYVLYRKPGPANAEERKEFEATSLDGLEADVRQYLLRLPELVQETHAKDTKDAKDKSAPGEAKPA